MNLTAVTHSLELVTAGAFSTDYTVDWTDIDKTAATSTTPGSAHGNISSASDTVIVTGPGSNVYRIVTSLTIKNKSGSTQTVTVQKDVSGAEYEIKSATLLTGQSLIYTQHSGWDVYNANGYRQGSGADGANGATGSAGVGTSGTAIVDFGAAPGKTDASVTVTGQAAIDANSKLEVWLAIKDSVDHSADEHWVDGPLVYAGNIVAGTGFTIYARDKDQVKFSPENLSGIRRAAGPALTTKINRAALLQSTNPMVWGKWNVNWRWS